jgi:RNA polymerase sigma factor (sigma-70 family)
MGTKLDAVGLFLSTGIDLSKEIQAEKFHFIRKTRLVIKEEVDQQQHRYPAIEVDARLIALMGTDRKFKRAVDDIIRANIKLIPHVIRVCGFCGRGVEVEDMLGEGVPGLQTAAFRYNIESKNQFSTYAFWWIRQAITRYIANRGKSIRLPIYVIEQLTKIKKSTSSFYGEHGRHPTLQELSALTEISQQKLIELKAIKHRTMHGVSLNSPENIYAKNVTEKLDNIAEEYFDERDIALADLVERVLDCSGLTPGQKEVIYLKYGVPIEDVPHNKDAGNLTLAQIARKAKLTRERVRQIEIKGMSKIKNQIIGRKIKEDLHDAIK